MSPRPPQLDMQFESLATCPICESSDLKIVDHAYNICACSCGYICDNPRPTLKSISEFYSAKGKYENWVSRDAAYSRLWKRRLRVVRKYAKPGNLLDIGAGTGQFLSIAKPHFTSVFGTEVSSSGAEVARERYKLTLTVGDIHSLSLPLNSFDNVTLFHVLEHVHDPLAMLIRSWELLSEDGMLFVCVPNDVLAWSSRIKALGKRIGVPQFQKFSPKFGMALVGKSSEIHLSHFMPNSLSKVVEKAGYNIRKIGLDPYFAASWPWTPPHFLYLGLHAALYRATGTSHYETIMLVAQKRK
jgi:ubiquinone/menaquinone biosynthesis C-methylase UbiE